MTNTDPYSALLEAIEAKDVTTALALIRAHPGFNTAPPPEGDSAWDIMIHFAPEMIGPALDAGLHPDFPLTDRHQTLLQQLICRNELDLIKQALAVGADIEVRNSEGETALGYAAAWAELPVVQFLIQSGAQPNAIEESPDGFQSSALDACTDRAEIFAYLRSVGAKRLSELREDENKS